MRDDGVCRCGGGPPHSYRGCSRVSKFECLMRDASRVDDGKDVSPEPIVKHKRARLARQIVCEVSLMAAGAAIMLWLFAP